LDKTATKKQQRSKHVHVVEVQHQGQERRKTSATQKCEYHPTSHAIECFTAGNSEQLTFVTLVARRKEGCAEHDCRKITNDADR
jgi:hypothetical protein